MLGLLNHNNDTVLGRTSAKTLILKEDSRGLAFQLRPGGSQLWRDTLDKFNVVTWLDALSRSLAQLIDSKFNPMEALSASSATLEVVDVSIRHATAYEQTSVSIFAGGARRFIRMSNSWNYRSG